MYIFFENTNTVPRISNQLNVEFRKVVPTAKTVIEKLLLIYWQLASWLQGERCYEYQILLENKVISYARVVPKNFMFKFIPNNGYHIGPCYTEPEHRGKGLYPLLLQHIMDDKPNTKFYMIIDENNISSIRGVRKVGFIEIAKGKKNIVRQWVKL